MKTYIPLYLLSILVTFVSCKKTDVVGTKEYVPAYLKAMAPYTNGQSVDFINGSGQLVHSTVAITSAFAYPDIPCSSCAAWTNPETITYTFTAGSNTFMVLKIPSTPYLSLSVSSPLHNYQSGGGFNILVETGVTQGSCGALRQACLPAITLNGKTFTNVLEITATSSTANPIKVYHTVSQGLVGFVYTNGTAYNLN